MAVKPSAEQLRVIAEGIRLVTLQTFAGAGSGHVGGSMSIIETLAVLYASEMRVNPEDPGWQERDRLVLSKGHAGPALYATLALRGYFPKEMLSELNQNGTHLPSHCDRTKTPGVDMTTGSLGQGISAAIGMALAARLDGSDRMTYLIIGDGECDEGQIWEGAMFAAHHKLDNLICFVDNNKQQLDGMISDVLDLGDIGAKFASFGWHVQNVNGHDCGAIQTAVNVAKNQKGKPSVIVLDTEKGYGCSFSEGVCPNHHQSFTPMEMEQAIENVKKRLTAAREGR